MLKHRGFPGRLPGTDHQFTIRRANPRGVTPLVARPRHADRRPGDRRADAAFLAALIAHFGAAPFPRGNLDAGRLGWLFGREVLPADDPFDPRSYDARLRVDLARARAAFPEIFAAAGPAPAAGPDAAPAAATEAGPDPGPAAAPAAGPAAAPAAGPAAGGRRRRRP